MKMYCYVIMLMVCATLASADSLTITGFQSNGYLTWTNGIDTNALYTVQWACRPSGPWHISWRSLHNINAQTDTVFSVRVPLFYRIAKNVFPTPANMVLIDVHGVDIGDSLADGSEDEIPVHHVEMGAYAISKYEVTNQEMIDCLQWVYDQPEGYLGVSSDNVWILENPGEGGSALKWLSFSKSNIEFTDGVFHTYLPNQTNYPANGITWYGASAYCYFQSLREGRDPCSEYWNWGTIDYSKNGYRLPTESEWECAARGGLRSLRFP